MCPRARVLLLKQHQEGGETAQNPRANGQACPDSPTERPVPSFWHMARRMLRVLPVLPHNAPSSQYSAPSVREARRPHGRGDRGRDPGGGQDTGPGGHHHQPLQAAATEAGTTSRTDTRAAPGQGQSRACRCQRRREKTDRRKVS